MSFIGNMRDKEAGVGSYLLFPAIYHLAEKNRRNSRYQAAL